MSRQGIVACAYQASVKHEELPGSNAYRQHLEIQLLTQCDVHNAAGASAEPIFLSFRACDRLEWVESGITVQRSQGEAMDTVRTQFERSNAARVTVTCARAGHPVIAGTSARGAALNAADGITRFVTCLPILGCPVAPGLSWRHAPAAGR